MGNPILIVLNNIDTLIQYVWENPSEYKGLTIYSESSNRIFKNLLA